MKIVQTLPQARKIMCRTPQVLDKVNPYLSLLSLDLARIQQVTRFGDTRDDIDHFMC